MASRVMRRILVDSAGSSLSETWRRCGTGVAGRGPHRLEGADPGSRCPDDALHALAALDLRRSQVVEMRFFGGLSVEETAESLHVSADRVMRDWRLAKVWLLRALSRTEAR
jgi:RNA polymerase sigma-70 factor (ECF subfamily)